MDNIWQDLLPDHIFKAVEQAINASLSNICLRRNSYINRVYELERLDNNERLIAKFYRPNRWSDKMIKEEHAFVAELAAEGLPVIAPQSLNGQTLFPCGQINFALFPKKGGRAMDEFDKETWKIIGRLLAKSHVIGAKHTASSRLTWEPEIATRQHLKTILESGYLLPEFQTALCNTVELFIKKSAPLFQGQERILLHGDCHKGNLIFRPNEGIYIIDFDDLCIGPPVQDLWMLLPDSPEQSPNELAWFLEGYSVFRDFSRRSLALVPVLRGMRIVHYLAWLAIQHKESEFPRHFPDAGSKRYWTEVIKELQEIVHQQIF